MIARTSRFWDTIIHVIWTAVGDDGSRFDERPGSWITLSDAEYLGIGISLSCLVCCCDRVRMWNVGNINSRRIRVTKSRFRRYLDNYSIIKIVFFPVITASVIMATTAVPSMVTMPSRMSI
jgi:hypothetical protein